MAAASCFENAPEAAPASDPRPLLPESLDQPVHAKAGDRRAAEWRRRETQIESAPQKPERNPQRLRTAPAAFSGSVAASSSEHFSSR